MCNTHIHDILCLTHVCVLHSEKKEGLDMDTQFKKGVLDICVLATISKNEMYGYGLKVEMAKLMDINENTLYPLLRRLEKDELLETYSKTSEAGRTRKYYSITQKGQEYLDMMSKEWKEFTKSVDRILEGGEDYE